MNRQIRNGGPQAGCRRIRPGLLLGLGLALSGCLRLDSFLFEPIRLDGDYFNPADMDSSWHARWIIPDSLIEPVTLFGLDSNRVYGFFVRQPVETSGTAPSEVTVIYSHGRGENINRYWGRVELLWEAGYSVFIYDYEGFGRSEGTPSGAGCYADAEAALAYVLARPDVTDSNIVYYAWSLGGFMACHLAADILTPRCLILENPMASMSALAREGAVLGIPGSFLVDADFDNESRIPLVGCRTLVLYGKADDTAVPERNALVLLDKADPLTTTGYPVKLANHSDVPERMTYPEYERVVRAFVAGDSL
jgi:alpha/beta superfamily hydrolase